MTPPYPPNPNSYPPDQNPQGELPRFNPPPPGWGAPPPPLPPRRPQKKKSTNILPILFGLFGLGMVGLFALGFLGRMLGGGSAATGGFASRVHLGSHDIGLLRISGAIMPGPQYDFWMSTLKEFAADDSMRGVILRIDSPGGAVGASQEIYDMVMAMRKPATGKGKKIFISMGDLAASGAYYISAAGDKIFANRGTLTGSIGVIANLTQIKGLAEKIGVTSTPIKTGRFKDSGSMFRDMTEEEKKMFNMLLGNALDQFKSDILREREGRFDEAAENLEEARWAEYQFTKPAELNGKELLTQIADGRVYSGEQGIELGLVDELGSEAVAVKALASELGLKGEPSIYEPRQKQSFFEMLNTKAKDFVPTALTQTGLQYRAEWF